MGKRADNVFWTVCAVSGLVTSLTLLTMNLNPAAQPPVLAGGGHTLPRMRGPVGNASTGELIRSMGIGSLTWYLSILSAPLFLWLSRRLPFDRRRWPASLAAHIAVVGALVAVTGLVQYQLTYAGYPGAPTMREYLRIVLLTGALPFVTVAAAAHALEARMRARDRELDA